MSRLFLLGTLSLLYVYINNLRVNFKPRDDKLDYFLFFIFTILLGFILFYRFENRMIFSTRLS